MRNELSVSSRADALIDITNEPATGQSIFDFMADIKISLKKWLPDALVSVEPHGRRVVRVRLEWENKRAGWCGAQQNVTVEEIAEAEYNLIERYLEIFKQLKANEESKHSEIGKPAYLR